MTPLSRLFIYSFIYLFIYLSTSFYFGIKSFEKVRTNMKFEIFTTNMKVKLLNLNYSQKKN